MAYLRSSVSRPFLSAIRSATVRPSPSIPRTTPSPSPMIGSGSSQPRRRVPFNTPRSAAAMGGAMSLLPLHSVVAAVRLNSKLLANSTACCGSFKGTFLCKDP